MVVEKSKSFHIKFNSPVLISYELLLEMALHFSHMHQITTLGPLRLKLNNYLLIQSFSLTKRTLIYESTPLSSILSVNTLGFYISSTNPDINVKHPPVF